MLIVDKLFNTQSQNYKILLTSGYSFWEIDDRN